MEIEGLNDFLKSMESTDGELTEEEVNAANEEDEEKEILGGEDDLGEEKEEEESEESSEEEASEEDAKPLEDPRIAQILADNASLKSRINELTAAMKSAEISKIEDVEYLSDEEFDDIISDRTKFNKFMNKFAAAVSERTASKAAEIAQSQVTAKQQAEQVVMQFRQNYSDIFTDGINAEDTERSQARMSQIQTLIRQTQSANPNMSAEEVFNTVGDTMRTTLKSLGIGGGKTARIPTPPVKPKTAGVAKGKASKKAPTLSEDAQKRVEVMREMLGATLSPLELGE